MLLGGRSILLVIGYGVITGSTGAIYFFLDAKSEGQLSTFEKSAHALTPEQKEQALTKLSEVIGRPILEAFINGDLPLVVIVMLFVSAFVTPGLVLLVGY